MGDYMATTIQISESTRNMLKSYGYKDDTYDEIINKLMKSADRISFFEEQKNILKSEKFYRAEEL